MPEFGETEPSVRFFVKVAADEFILDRVMDIKLPPLPTSIILDFTRYTGFHVTHHIIKLFFINTGRGQVCAAPAYGFIRLVVGASESTGRADIDAPAAQTADLRFGIKGCVNAPFFASSVETDGLGHHLFLAHADAQSAEDTILMFLAEPHLPYLVCRGQVLDNL